jgi:uncharacterized protein YjbJ (UPF0337 family)
MLQFDAVSDHTTRSDYMNWDQIEGNWKQFVGHAKQKWAKLTDSDWNSISGKRDVLVGRLQERYGYAKEEAEREADEWGRSVDQHQQTY